MARLAATGDGLDVNLTEFVPHGLMGIPAMASVGFDPNADAVDLTGIGMPVAVPTALVTQVKNDTATVTADPHPRITRRADLMSGVLGERHLQDARDLREQIGRPGTACTTCSAWSPRRSGSPTRPRCSGSPSRWTTSRRRR